MLGKQDFFVAGAPTRSHMQIIPEIDSLTTTKALVKVGALVSNARSTLERDDYKQAGDALSVGYRQIETTAFVFHSASLRKERTFER
jgi:hypothetical protein